MKRYTLILLFCVSALTLFAQITQFKADITDMTPMSYPPRSGLSDFSFEVRNDSAFVHLPYIGEVYNPTMGNDGLNFSEPIKDVTCKQTKKKDGQILSFSVKHDIVSYWFSVTLWDNNRLDIFMRPSNAQPCSYMGDWESLTNDSTTERSASMLGSFLAKGKRIVPDWSNPSSWFADSNIGNMSPDPEKVDVFYLVSTDVLTATDEYGNEIWRSQLTKEDLALLDEEIKWVKDSVFYNDFNFFSPHYHQYTYMSFVKHEDKADSLSFEVGKEAYDAFDYYMKHINRGRPFILIGFSQGGDMAMQILRRMTKKQYSRMVAAYVVGWKVTASDTVNYSNIIPAKGEKDTGVTISYNTVLNKDGVWNFVAGGTKACINPVNWKTDGTPAEFTFYGKPHKVHVETLDNRPDASTVLVMETDPEPYHKLIRKIYPPAVLPSINMSSLHHWELSLYRHQIHDNALKRWKAFK